MTVTTLPTSRGETRGPVALDVPAAPAAEIVYEPAPDGAPADAPRIFAAINSVMRDAMPVSKDQRNTSQNYAFRGIDDVMSAMAGPFRTHGVFILPRLAEQQQERDGKMTRTVILMRYRVYGPAGDCLVAEVPGEAHDFADKSMNKAQSAALKYLLFALFMLPVDGRSIDDGDRDHPAQESAEEKPKRSRARRQERPAQAEQAPPASTDGPSRDYLGEAANATSAEQYEAIVQAAREARAPAPYLAMLTAIGKAHRAADVAAVRALHKRLTADGAPPVLLGRVAEIGSRKPGTRARKAAAARPAPHEHRFEYADDGHDGHAGSFCVVDGCGIEQPAGPAPVAATLPGAPDDRQALGLAQVDCLAAGRAVGLAPGEVQQAFAERFGHGVDKATVAELAELTADLQQAARSAR